MKQKPMNENRITLYKRSEDDRFLAQIEQKGGKPIAITDQTYNDLGDLLEAVFAFKREAEVAPILDRTDGKPGQAATYEFEVITAGASGCDGCDGFVWRFQGPNNRTLFVSAPEQFRDIDSAVRAVEALKKLSTACIVDETGDPIDVEYYAGTNEPAPLGARYKIRVDREKVVVHEPTPTGGEILRAADRTPISQWQLYQKFRGGDTKPVSLNERVDLTCAGVERFQAVELTVTDGSTKQSASTITAYQVDDGAKSRKGRFDG